MNDIFNSLGNFFFWIFAICIGVLAGIVWYIFEYWYLFFGIPLIGFIIFYIANYKEIKAEYEAQMDEIERQEEEKRQREKNKKLPN